MKVVFLDFDGVLVNRKSWRIRSADHASADPDCVRALNKITTRTGAAIVVTSTWRIGRSVSHMRDILGSWGVSAKVIGCTPRLQSTYGLIVTSRPRGEEIQAWIDAWMESREPLSLVILDDENDMGERLEKFLVKTDFETGLNMAHAERAIAILGTSKVL